MVGLRDANASWAPSDLLGALPPRRDDRRVAHPSRVRGRHAGHRLPESPDDLYRYPARHLQERRRGSTWAARNTGFPTSDRLPYINVLVMDPVNPKILY